MNLGRCTMNKVSTLLALSLTMVLAVAFGGNAQSTDETVIRCSGADSMRGRIHTVAVLFMRVNPNLKVEIAKGKTLDVGIMDILNKRADVAMASRKINATEKKDASKKGVNLSESLVGYGGIVVLTHASNPLTALTVDQVKGIFKGEYTNWKQLGGPDQPIQVFRSDVAHPGTLVFMQDEFLGGAKFTDKSIPMNTFSEILRNVSGKPGAIGYTRIRDAFEVNRPAEEKVKILAIKKNADAPAVMPSRKNVRNETYSLRRPYYLYCDAGANEAVKSFVNFVVDKGWGTPGL